MTRRNLAHLTAVALLAALAGACTVEPGAYDTDADVGSTHAVIAVERSEVAVDETSRATALAGFLKIPAGVRAESVQSLVGLRTELPELGKCHSTNGLDTTNHGPLTSMAHVEFAEAGNVELRAGGRQHSLAPNAFPTVTDFISGVVYTSRKVDSEPLPTGQDYLVRVDGSPALDGFELEVTAPEAVQDVSIGGVALGEVSEVSTADPIDVTWAVGSAEDWVYVELRSLDRGAHTICAFRDDAGTGTVPTGAFEAFGDGILSVHRLRRESFTQPTIDRGEVRFDFELTRRVSFN